MRRTKSPTESLRRADWRPEAETGLRELLDHLGRLLAKEYVGIVAGEGADKATRQSEEER